MQVPVRRVEIVWSEVMLGVITLMFALTLHPFGIVIAANGVLCHGTHALRLRVADTLRKWDIECNIVMSVYVNLQLCAQPFCAIVTAIALVSWLANQYNESPTHKAFVHATCVQFPLFLGLVQYVTDCDRAPMHV